MEITLLKALSRQIIYPQKTHTPRRENPKIDKLVKNFCDLDPDSAKLKMQIRVKCSCGEENCSEWAIVEVQGAVEAQPSVENHIQNLQIGVLCRPSSQESYTFTVGYHELLGAKLSLKKPILVLKKIELQQDSDPDSKKVELDVIGVIRHKILFKTRPKALISRTQPFVKEKISAPASSVLKLN